MDKWRFWRRQPTPRLPDVARPATSYLNSRGGWAAGAAPADQPGWNAPTRIDDPPILLTYAQRRLYRSQP